MRFFSIMVLTMISIAGITQSSIYNPRKPRNCVLYKTGPEQPLKGRVWVVESEYEADLLVHVTTYPEDSAFAVKIFDHHRINPDCGEWSIVNMYDNYERPTHDFKIALTRRDWKADLIILLDYNRSEDRSFLNKYDGLW